MKMTSPILLLLMLCGTTVLGTVQDSWKDYLQDKLLRVLETTQRYKRQADDEPKQPPHATVTFEECSQEDDAVLVNYVNVEPNPVEFPGEMKIVYSVNVRENTTKPIKGELTMTKKISLLFGLTSWFEIPCLDHKIGSCTFDDICENEIILEGFCRQSDGTEICGCPFVTGNQTSKPVSYSVPAFPEDIPTYLLRGDFLAKVVLSKDDKQIACHQANFFMEI